CAQLYGIDAELLEFADAEVLGLNVVAIVHAGAIVAEELELRIGRPDSQRHAHNAFDIQAAQVGGAFARWVGGPAAPGKQPEIPRRRKVGPAAGRAGDN